MNNENNPQQLIDTFDTQRILHDAELIKAGAAMEAGRLVLTNLQVKELESSGDSTVQYLQDLASTNYRTEIIENTEQNVEKLRGLIKESAYVAHTWLVGRDISNDKGDSKLGCFQSVYNKRGAAKHLEYVKTRRDIQEQLSDNGISEIVTKTILKNKFDKIDVHSPKSTEPLVVITYETTEGNRYKAFDPMGRPGNTFRLHLLLPESDANGILAMAQDNPKIMRDLADIIMDEDVGAVTSWREARPPYEAWKAQDGGIAKMAFRSGINDSAAEAVVIQH